jgi:hypothetical protein
MHSCCKIPITLIEGGGLTAHKLIWLFLAFAVGTSCVAVANFLAFEIFARLETLGYLRRWWRMEDLRLYRLYWNLAPEHGWSRAPLVMAVALMMVAVSAVLLATFGS